VIDKAGEGYRRFVAIGGDGTVHEVVNGIMKQNILPPAEITLAAIPVGTGNDWAKHHGITCDLAKLVNAIKENRFAYQDVGKALFIHGDNSKEEYFNNVAGMAYDAFVVEQLEKKVKKPNKLIYILSVLGYLFKYKLQKAEVNIDGRLFRDKYYTINVGVCKYSGGGMSLVPHAIHDDGLLAVTLAGQLRKIDVLLNTYRFYNESLIDHPLVDAYQAKEVGVMSIGDDPIRLELDGELAGYNPIRFSVVEKALKFVK
jgi:diacylglycerol kinase family enzyme